MSINSGSSGSKFEEAVRELERIAEELERGDVSLDRTVELYNRGIELHKYCDKVIKGITLNVESLGDEELE
ncbi:putative exodeoxyribonuclease VII small subunit [Anaplasma centrale str. Israel]|uniref:Exodeoxyribonuclease 7 small subunit n=1 Tax=Anaplasma centrale (strain Israel) TaxID=574556 RepID=D1AT26_ANACI|nr:exodeoxyribonuclease VII small subunit [Anaplasma centrale]ACZ49629.1 putative exodeoxyribonuclease VII small subunit [Anaplasma centrale str. Israel]